MHGLPGIRLQTALGLTRKYHFKKQGFYDKNLIRRILKRLNYMTPKVYVTSKQMATFACPQCNRSPLRQCLQSRFGKEKTIS
jgi:hypothetical protein